MLTFGTVSAHEWMLITPADQPTLSSTRTNTPMSGNKPTMSLLSLDGGGIRGASMLIILEELMRRLAYDMDNDDLKPCEVFDMIGGSGMGGIIAILLGRLGLGVAQATSAYTKLSQELYEDGYSKETMGPKLKQAIQKLLKNHGLDENSRMLTPKGSENKCKTFVVANMTQNLANPVLFRGYRPRRNPSANCHIWEAARATTAHRQLYPDISIPGDDGISVTYVGTEYRGNNPTQYVINEFKSEFPGQKIASLISIGAGHPGPISLPNQTTSSGHFSNWGSNTQNSTVLQGLTETLEKIGKDCEETADRIEGVYLEVEQDTGSNPYTRLNVEQGMQTLSIGEMDIPGKVKAHTISYLQQHKVSRVVDQTLMKMAPRAQERIEEMTTSIR